jgi:hypothetical protein
MQIVHLLLADLLWITLVILVVEQARSQLREALIPLRQTA